MFGSAHGVCAKSKCHPGADMSCSFTLLQALLSQIDFRPSYTERNQELGNQRQALGLPAWSDSIDRSSKWSISGAKTKMRGRSQVEMISCNFSPTRCHGQSPFTSVQAKDFHALESLWLRRLVPAVGWTGPVSWEGWDPESRHKDFWVACWKLLRDGAWPRAHSIHALHHAVLRMNREVSLLFDNLVHLF